MPVVETYKPIDGSLLHSFLAAVMSKGKVVPESVDQACVLAATKLDGLFAVGTVVVRSADKVSVLATTASMQLANAVTVTLVHLLVPTYAQVSESVVIIVS